MDGLLSGGKKRNPAGFSKIWGWLKLKNKSVEYINKYIYIFFFFWAPFAYGSHLHEGLICITQPLISADPSTALFLSS